MSAISSFLKRVEGPTVGLSAVIYGSWIATTLHFHDFPIWLNVLVGGALVAWHGSLQHEATHGHPTPYPTLNTALAGWSLGLYLPYPLYRESHLAHHSSPHLTDPLEDPESWYAPRSEWARFGGARRALRWVNATLAGRLILGPLLVALRLWVEEVSRFAAGDFRHARAWLWHLATTAAILAWVVVVCDIPVWVYVLCYAYPGLALTLLRSFAEHRPGESQHERTAVVEAGPVFSLLFLNNNLHSLHHAKPRLPWYRYRYHYRLERDNLLRRNGGYVIPGYGSLVARYLLRPKDRPVHPRS